MGSGDSGQGTHYPAVSPNVLAVGGTYINPTDSAGNYTSESGWSGSSGGISSYESMPVYQKNIVTQSSTNRTMPDVAYNASSSSAVAVYNTYPYSGWIGVYGTSMGAPQIASLVAIINQGRAIAGAPPLNGRNELLPALYNILQENYHDITAGSNGYSAVAGYDLVTGRGTPVANILVPSLLNIIPIASDTTPPTTPTNLIASSITNTSAVLNWAASADDKGVAGYNILRNGVKIATSSITTYTDTALAICTTYNYAITAYDAAGNVSGLSPTVTVKTTGCVPDTTPPTVIITNPANGSKISSKGVTNISVTASDISGISTIKILLDSVVKQTCSAVTSCSLNISNKKISSGSHIISAIATDKAVPANTARADITVTK